MTVTVDRRAEKAMLARYTPEKVTSILKEAAKEGGKAGAAVLRSAAPIGTSQRLSQYYRRMGLGHGTFRRSVRAAAIRARGGIGSKIGPMGRNAFTRGWIELGTTHSRANPWVERSATSALNAAQRGSEAVLERYSND